jgi:hypothetical protein
MSGGYIRVYRRVLEDPFLLPFNHRRERFVAWLDLIALASWDSDGIAKTHSGYSRGDKKNRGEVNASLAGLGERWKWTKTEVHTFLHQCVKLGMVELSPGSNSTCIKILNYDRYQGGGEKVEEAPKATKAKKAKKAKAKVAIETDDERRVWEEIERTRKIGYERLGRKPGNYTIDASRIRLVKTKLEEYGIDMVLDACRGAAISTYHAAYGEKEGQPIKLMPENILGKTAKINQLEVCAEIWENRRRKQRPKRAEESFRSLVEVTQGMEADA